MKGRNFLSFRRDRMFGDDLMRARSVFAALVAMFDRPAFNDAPPVQVLHARVAESEGLVSIASAHRVRTAFERFARFVRGGG